MTPASGTRSIFCPRPSTRVKTGPSAFPRRTARRGDRGSDRGIEVVRRDRAVGRRFRPGRAGRARRRPQVSPWTSPPTGRPVPGWVATISSLGLAAKPATVAGGDGQRLGVRMTTAVRPGDSVVWLMPQGPGADPLLLGSLPLAAQRQWRAQRTEIVARRARPLPLPLPPFPLRDQGSWATRSWPLVARARKAGLDRSLSCAPRRGGRRLGTRAGTGHVPDRPAGRSNR